jgi:hypothetical protein
MDLLSAHSEEGVKLLASRLNFNEVNHLLMLGICSIALLSFIKSEIPNINSDYQLISGPNFGNASAILTTSLSPRPLRHITMS